MRALLLDFRHAWRSLARAPQFSALLVAMLALGIGAVTFAFTFLHGTVLRPLPFPEPERLVQLVEFRTDGPREDWMALSPADFLDLRGGNTPFEATATFYSERRLVRFGEEPERREASLVMPSLFAVLGVPALRGRTLSDADAEPGAEPVVVVSERLWRTRLAAKAEVLGSALEVQGRVHTIVGVMPAGFGFPNASDLWLPWSVSANLSPRDAHWMPVIARLAPGVTHAQAAAIVLARSAAIAREHPATNQFVRATVRPSGEFYGGTMRKQALLFMVGALLLLLLVCANVANLLWARAHRRSREWSLRGSLGAPMGRIAGLVLAECAWLAVLGAGGGLALTALALRAVSRAWTGDLPFWWSLSLDGSVLACTVLATAFAAGVAGLGPALHATRTTAAGRLRDGGITASEGPAALRLRRGLVAFEIALSLTLLVCAGLLTRSFVAISNERGRIDRNAVVVSRLTLPFAEFDSAAKREALLDEVLPRIAALPGVRGASTVSMLPFDEGTNFRAARAEDGRDPRTHDGVPANLLHAGPGYFSLLGIPVLEGRSFEASDRAGSPAVGLVSRSLARALYPGQSPLGKRLFLGSRSDSLAWVTIVGVVPDLPQAVREAGAENLVFRPWEQESWWSADRWLVTRMAPGTAFPGAAVRATLGRVGRAAAVSEIRPLDAFIDDGLSRERLLSGVSTVFAIAGLFIAVLGLYGVIAYAMSLRTREIGIRMVLGADRGTILRWVMRGAGGTIAAGALLGLAGAWAATRLLEGLLVRTERFDPAVWMTVSGMVLALSLIATWLPARQATRVHPMVALRQD